jgi:hypothetical protein
VTAGARSWVAASGVTPRSYEQLLLAYGLYTVAVAIVQFVHGGVMVLGDPSVPGAGERAFIGHMTQAHAGSLIGLGCMALALRRVGGEARSIHAVLLLANLLMICVELFAPAADESTMWHTTAAVIHGVWSVGFASAWWSGRSTKRYASRVPWWGTALLLSFAVLVIVSGIIWLLAPLKFAAAASGGLAGPAVAYIGHARGAADVPLGMIALVTIIARRPSVTSAVAAGLCIANVLLAIAGLLAQLSMLATPARWVVEGLHVLWAAGFACLWVLHARRAAMQEPS